MVDQMEALGFGILALENIRGRTANSPKATGASKHVLCGEIAPGHRKKHVRRLRKIFQDSIT